MTALLRFFFQRRMNRFDTIVVSVALALLFGGYGLLACTAFIFIGAGISTIGEFWMERRQ